VRLIFSERAWAEYLHWQATDRALLERVNVLVKECSRTPFSGIGKPEPLRGGMTGWWSRRINREHRLVYRPTEDGLLIAQCRFHY
jgi:toxin YoeB